MKKYIAGSLIAVVACVGLFKIARAYYPPIIVHVEPQNQIVKSGENAAWYATIDSKTQVQYQWYLNGHPLMGATGPALIRHGIRKTDEGVYTLETSNRFGKTVSDPYQLVVK